MADDSSSSPASSHASITDEGEKSTSGTSDNSPAYNGAKGATESPLAHRETRLVSCSKIVVLIVLALATACVSITVFKYTSREEEDDFETRVSMVP